MRATGNGQDLLADSDPMEEGRASLCGERKVSGKGKAGDFLSPESAMMRKVPIEREPPKIEPVKLKLI